MEFDWENILKAKLLPAITFEKAEAGLPVAEALLTGGLSVMEIPFRTASAGNAITQIRKKFPEMNIGAGTLLDRETLQQAINAGAMFGLAPGFNATVCQAAAEKSFPFIPGVMTPSEMEQAFGAGCRIQKFFPAEQLGGSSFLKAMEGPYEQLGIRFIPMGGVRPANLMSYLSLKNVIAAGGSWMASTEMIRKEDYTTITKNVKRAIEMIQHSDALS